ncbi:sugar kinase [Streptomyces sp. NPDC091217]|uniref:sugar kinase n=1 Tax=Streptomyces sp. NPDC091217 TaxID=3365975 RepID=UPI0038073FFA
MSVVLCVGEALISLTPATGVPLITAPELSVSEGGAEVNVAVNLARLGVPTRFAGRVGADPFGTRIRTTLADAGVDARFLESDPRRPTGLYVKDARPDGTTMRYYRQTSAATAYRRVPDAALDGVDQVHLSGITPALSDDCEALVGDLLHRKGRYTVSFDVNHRAALWPPGEAAEPLRVLAQRADTVLVGADEAATLWGTDDPDGVRKLLTGPSELVVKDGAGPAVAFADGQRYAVAAPAVEVVEPVGAGDAFAAGYLAARRFGRPPLHALRWGHLLAAAVLRVHSDHAAPPDRRELERLADDGSWNRC